MVRVENVHKSSCKKNGTKSGKKTETKHGRNSGKKQYGSATKKHPPVRPHPLTQTLPLSGKKKGKKCGKKRDKKNRGKQNGAPSNQPPPRSLPLIETLSLSGDNVSLANPRFFFKEAELHRKAAANWTSAIFPVQRQLQQTRSAFPFKKLPVELRHAIWKLAAPESQVIEITFKEENKDKAVGFYSNTPTPVILFVCQDSRQAAMDIYKKLILNGVFTRTYVRWETDVIFLASAQCALALFTTELSQKKPWNSSSFNQKCRRLAIPNDRTVHHLLPQLVPGIHLPNMTELMLVHEKCFGRDWILKELIDISPEENARGVIMLSKFVIRHKNVKKTSVKKVVRKDRVAKGRY